MYLLSTCIVGFLNTSGDPNCITKFILDEYGGKVIAGSINSHPCRRTTGSNSPCSGLGFVLVLMLSRSNGTFFLVLNEFRIKLCNGTCIRRTGGLEAIT